MKVYVDELPKSCKECPMCRSGNLKLQRKGRYIETEQCVFGQYKYQNIDDEIDTCPLQSLTDYAKQVRKEGCEEIRSRFLATCQIEKGCDTASFSLEVLNRILDQIQDKGEKK